MEFRVFVPLLVSTDVEWLTPSEYSSYIKIIDDFNIFIEGLMNAQPPEVRGDNYLIGGEYYGLKLRAGKKLEIKVRTDLFPPSEGKYFYCFVLFEG